MLFELFFYSGILILILIILGILSRKRYNLLVYNHGTRSEGKPELRIANEVGFGPDEVEQVSIQTPDKIELYGWFIHGNKDISEGVPTILYFYQNGTTIGHNATFLYQLSKHVGCNIFTIDYRGYGHSQGEPSTYGLKIDGRTALNYLCEQRKDIDRSRIIVFGSGLGGAVAAHTGVKASQRADIAGMVIENTFAHQSIMFKKEGFFTKMLLGLYSYGTYRWYPRRIIKSKGLNVPTLFLSGKIDSVVPEKDMEEIYKAAISTMPVYRGNRVSFKSFPYGNHEKMFLQEGYFETLRKWMVENFGFFPPGPLGLNDSVVSGEGSDDGLDLNMLP